MRNNSIFALSALAAALALVGAGCMETGNELADDALKPVAVPVGALKDAQGLSEDLKAKKNLEEESMANEMTVAMILTEGSQAPAGVTPGDTIGCNDRVAFIKVPRESDSGDTLKDALNSLFAVKDPSYGGLHDSLALSTLKVDKIQSTDGVTTEIWLAGQVSSGGACDDPRIKAQVEYTVKRLKPKYKILLNGEEDDWRCLGDQSGQCGSN
jgi:hypothetical protein